MGVTGTGTLELRSKGTAYDVTPFFRKFTWCDSLLDGGWSWSGSFAVNEWSDWNDFLIGSDNPVRAFRLSTQPADTRAAESSTPWRTAILDTSRCAVRGTSLVSRVYGGDKRLLMAQKDRTRAWPSSRVSDVINQIASEYGFTSRVAATSARRDRWQIREDDWSYVSRLSREAATASGRGDAFVWLDGDVLSYGAPDLAAASARRHDLADVENRVDRAIVSYQGRAVDRDGGATALGVGYDLDNAVPVVFRMDGAAARTMPALASRVPRDPAGGLRVYAVDEDASALVEEAVRARWGRVGPRYLAMRLDTRGDVTVGLGTVVEVQANLSATQNSPFFGRYVVLEIRHTLVGGLLRTSLSCYRREAFTGSTTPTGASASAAGTTDRYGTGQDDTPSIVLQARPIG